MLRQTSLLLALTLPLLAQSQTPPPEQGKVKPTGKFQPKAPANQETKDKVLDARFQIRELDARRIKIGEIIIHRTERTITFPVAVAVRDQLLEYLLVHETGKTHESLLTTKIFPRDLHLAALLLGVNGQSPKIELTWRKNGPDARRLLTEMIGAVEGTAPLASGKWHYSGSTFDSRGFVAQREGSFITVLDDPASLIRHPDAIKLGQDDQFRPAIKQLPPKGTPIKILLTFPKPIKP